MMGKRLFLLIFSFVLLVFFSSCKQSGAKTIQFQNPIIEQKVRKYLQKEDGEAISKEELLSITGFSYCSMNDKHEEKFDLKDFSMLPNLSYINLEYVTLENIKTLRTLRKLDCLQLHVCKFDVFPSLRKASQLTTVNLSYCDGFDNLNGLKGLKNLEDISLWWCKDINDISALEGMTTLTSLSIIGADISDFAVLASLTNLEDLCLEVVKAEDLSPLLGLTKLTYLQIPYFTSKWQYDELTKAFPGCEIWKNGGIPDEWLDD